MKYFINIGKLLTLTLVSSLMLALNLNVARGAGTEPRVNLCKALKNEKGAVAYLIDAKGYISKGPINFGRYAYSYQNRDYFYIPTNYRMVISPSRIEVSEYSGGGLLKLTKTASVCPNSRTYSISYTLNESKSNKPLHAMKLPFKENIVPDLPTMEDPDSYTGWVDDLKLRFDLRVIGEVFDARKR